MIASRSYVASVYISGFHTEGGPWDHPRIFKNYDVIALKDEKRAVILHTSDGNLGAVS